jgi:hypothetical protein
MEVRWGEPFGALPVGTTPCPIRRWEICTFATTLQSVQLARLLGLPTHRTIKTRVVPLPSFVETRTR